MSIPAVEGYGQITAQNAPKIYADLDTYNKLSPDQKHLVDRLVPDEKKDEIDYQIRNENAEKSGKSKVEDSEKAEKHGGQGGNATATSIGIAAGAAGAVAITKAAMIGSVTSGWAGFGLSIAVMGCALLSVICAKAFDNGYKDRTACEDNSGNTNDTLDAQGAALESSMDMMDEDYEAYMKDSENYMKLKNDDYARMEQYQVQLTDANNAGDAKGAQEASEQIEKLQSVDYSQQEEALDEKKKGIDEYRTMASETDGVIDGGTSVSDFLKQGTALGAVATFDALLLAIATAMCGKDIAAAHIGSTASEGHLDFAGGVMGMVAMAIYGISVGIFGMATAEMGKKAKKEFECGSAGRDMQGHVNALADMQESQINYTDQTEESYGKEDDKRTENNEEGEEAANEVSGRHGGPNIHTKPGKKDDDDDDDKKGGKSGSGSGNKTGAAA